jgi:hypothetical protein
MKTSNPNPSLPVIGDPLWGVQMNAILADLQRRVSALEGAEPAPGPSPGTYTNTATRAAPTSPGQVTMDGPQDDPGTVWVSLVDAAGTDQTAPLAAISSGSILGLEQADDATKWQQYYAVGPAVLDAVAAALQGAVHWNAGTPLDAGAAVLVRITGPTARGF